VATREARCEKRLNRKGQELKTNVTDPDSAKMATSKGVLQGYAAQAAVAYNCMRQRDERIDNAHHKAKGDGATFASQGRQRQG
jgi:hypothetical protein